MQHYHVPYQSTDKDDGNDEDHENDHDYDDELINACRA